MKKGKTIIAFILCLALLIVQSACGDSGKALAKVGNTSISEPRVNEMAEFIAIANGAKLSDLDKAMQEDVKNSMLIFFVDSELMKIKYKGKNIFNSDKKKQDEDAIRQVLSQTSQAGSGTIRDQLKSVGVTEDTLRYYYESQHYAEEFSKEVKEKDPVKEDEIQKYYDDHKAEYTTPGSFKVSHILIGTEAHTADDKATMEAILKEAKGGADFLELAKQYSQDEGTATTGGIYEATEGMSDTAFEEAAMKLKKGKISPIVESSFGFHIMKALEDPVPSRPMTLEEAKAGGTYSQGISDILEGEHYQNAIKKMEEEYKGQIKWNVEVDPETGLPPTDTASKQQEEAASNSAIEGETTEEVASGAAAEGEAPVSGAAAEEEPPADAAQGEDGGQTPTGVTAAD